MAPHSPSFSLFYFSLPSPPGFAALEKEGGIASLCASQSIQDRTLEDEEEDEDEEGGEWEGSGSDDSAILLSPAEPLKPPDLVAPASLPTHTTSLLGREEVREGGRERRRSYSSTDILSLPGRVRVFRLLVPILPPSLPSPSLPSLPPSLRSIFFPTTSFLEHIYTHRILFLPPSLPPSLPP